MFCLLAIDVFISNFYLVFTTFIRFVSFCTVITFYDIFAFLVNVFIFITIKTLNYSTFFYKHHCIFLLFSFKKISKIILLTFFENSVLIMSEKIAFFNFFLFLIQITLVMFKFL